MIRFPIDTGLAMSIYTTAGSQTAIDIYETTSKYGDAISLTEADLLQIIKIAKEQNLLPSVSIDGESNG